MSKLIYVRLSIFVNVCTSVLLYVYVCVLSTEDLTEQPQRFCAARCFSINVCVCQKKPFPFICRPPARPLMLPPTPPHPTPPHPAPARISCPPRPGRSAFRLPPSMSSRRQHASMPPCLHASCYMPPAIQCQSAVRVSAAQHGGTARRHGTALGDPRW
jgi:hypothetical protein